MWKPEYFDVNIFASALTPSGEDVGAPEKVRIANPYEWAKVIEGGLVIDPQVRLGLVTKLSARLGEGWILTVPDYDDAYLLDETGGTGGPAKTLLWIKVSDLTPTTEDRVRPRRRITQAE